MNQFKDLKIWQDAINLGVEIYKLTKLFPSDEKFGLVSQMNRCAVSISSNIASANFSILTSVYLIAAGGSPS
jgi:four helix bundle protein